MKTSFVLNVFWLAVISAMLSLSAPVFADSNDMLNQAVDLVHQALNPGGDPPSNDVRTDLLTQALKLTQSAPARNYRGHRVKAILDINAALFTLKQGDPDNKASDEIRDALDELRTSLSIGG